ncbi:MAG: FAD-dependent monooxygenase [Actinobacteria bacterium]|nr:FAD-dependent monooxygenase [Actinomycetota bacterium]
MNDMQNTRRAARPDCQVLVVGAGPTGLTLAADLLARGVTARIIDKGHGAALETRAVAVHGRAMEVLDLMGLADRFIARGQVVRRFSFYTDGRHRLSLDLARNGTRFGFMLDIPQHDTESLLRARIAELGGVIEQGTELTGLTDEEACVTASVTDAAGQPRVITAGYLVGCDGAHSRVRHELGLPFHGHPYPQEWLLADVRLDWGRPEDEVHAFFRADGVPLICFPMRDHRWRLVVPFAGRRTPGAPDLAEIQHLVDQRAPERIAVSDPTWLASFNCHRRSTNVYRRGHVLLAGDAVHIHTPAGGQGMNTGITDAHNLAWKLALVAAGRAPEQLLDTYGAEREPVAAQVLGLTHTLVRFGTMTHPVKRALRDTMVPAAFRIGPIHRRAVRRWTQVNVGYPASSLTRPDRGRGPLRPGQRAPDVEVCTREGTSRLFSVLRRGRHVLVVTGADPVSAPAGPALTPYRDLFEVVTPGPRDARAFRRTPAGSVFLVRPDGYIAARGTPDRLHTVLDYLRRLSSGTGIRRPGQPPASGQPGPALAAVR